MTNDDMIEKVARALCEAAGDDWLPTSVHWDELDGESEEYRKSARAALSALGLLDGSNMLIPNWRDISEAPKDGQCLVLTPEGHDISEYSDAEPDYPDQMGHDAGWWGMLTPADPGRSIGNPDYRRGPTCQPTHFIPLSSIPTPEDTDD